MPNSKIEKTGRKLRALLGTAGDVYEMPDRIVLDVAGWESGAWGLGTFIT